MAKKKSEDVVALEAAKVDEQLPVEIVGNQTVEIPPAMTDHAWSDYVMKHFEEDEIYDGLPTVDGLRRVAELLVGEIIDEKALPFAWPGGTRDNKSATVQFTVVFLTPSGVLKTFAEVADVTIANTEADYANYPSPTASTRAEGRALRKALKLRRVLAAEEVNQEVVKEADGSVKIKDTQINYLKNTCKRNNINLKKFVNSGPKKYEKLKEVSYDEALDLIKRLSEYQRVQSTIPAELKGWEDS